MSQGRRRLGRRGESAAEAFLVRRGYRILARNYRCPLGELDLVASDRGVVVFVEVKTRRGARAGSGAEAVSARKRWRLMRLAQCYLASHGLEGVPCRFDVVSLLVRPCGARVQLWRDAFQRGEGG